MKNVMIAVLAVCTLAGGYYAVYNTVRLNTFGIEGKTVKLARGNLTLPITATGEVQPYLRAEIKSEASGAVQEIGKHAGELVKRGELLIRLQPDDEQRSVDRARQELAMAEARLAEAKIGLEQAEKADLASAKAQVDKLKQAARLSKFRLDKVQAEDYNPSPDELLQRETTHKSQLADLAAAEAAYEKARLAIPRARQLVKQFEAQFEAAKSTLGDAEKRLDKTDIVSPIDGVVADIRTQVGAVIQGGKTTFTAGTVLAVVYDMSRLVVRAEVDEADIGRVREISPVWARPGRDGTAMMPADLERAAAAVEHVTTIHVEAFRNETFEGVIERIYPEPRLDRNVTTYRVDVAITSANRDMLLVGMRADVKFTAEYVEDVVLCPNEAIREGPGGRLGVFVPQPAARPGDRPEPKFIPCVIGLDNGAFSEIRDGLDAGMDVYTKLPAELEDRRDKRKRNT
ncbi:MAG: efflux RND transporter periplasmic adaptor subunit [Phycisphaerae bacterium]